MSLLASESLLRENKKLHSQNVTPSGNKARPLRFQVQHAPSYTNWALATWEIFKHLLNIIAILVHFEKNLLSEKSV